MKERKFGKKKSGYKGYIGNLERGETKRGERKRKTVKIIKRKRRNGRFGEEANNRARPEIRLGNVRLFYESCESSY